MNRLTRGTRRAALLGVPAAVLLSGCGTSKSPSMLDPKGTEARDVAGVWWLMFAIACGVAAGRYPLRGPDFHRLDTASFAWRTG